MILRLAIGLAVRKSLNLLILKIVWPKTVSTPASKARSMAPSLVTPDDIMEFDLDGNALDPRGRTLYTERFIHSEIYKADPAVNAIVHSHSPSIIPFGATAVPLRPIYHMSSFLGAGVPIFEIREAGGPATDMLIRSPELGAALARRLGHSAVVLMRGHGDVVVGDSLQQVVPDNVAVDQGRCRSRILERLPGSARKIGGRIAVVHRPLEIDEYIVQMAEHHRQLRDDGVVVVARICNQRLCQAAEVL